VDYSFKSVPNISFNTFHILSLRERERNGPLSVLLETTY